MQQLPAAFASMAGYAQFILWTTAERNGKIVKLPVDYRTIDVADAHDPAIWMDADTAINMAKLYGDKYGVGFVFTKNDPFFFADLDKCLNPDGATWSDVANDVLNHLPGAAVEISQSGKGLHIFGTGITPDHACKNTVLGLELYTEGRFVALTGTGAMGSAAVDCSATLPALVSKYFPPKQTVNPQEWTTAPDPRWGGPTDDDKLIEKALASKSAGSAFGKRASFADLWNKNVEVLSDVYAPDASDTGGYDESSADAALAQHLAFWTGNDCERILRLMWKSGLVRDKWTWHKTFLTMTITRAVSLQEMVYTGGKINDSESVLKIKGTPKQVAFANNIIEKYNDPRIISMTGPALNAKFWIENQGKTIDELITITTPIESASDPMGSTTGPEVVTGYQFLGATQQIEHFAGCVYIQKLHRVFTPGGQLLKAEQFNATYGGYVFQLDSDTGGKTTRKAWEAFTESQVVRYPKADNMCFRPDMAQGTLIVEEGETLVNTYVPIDTPRQPGDVTPFIQHLAKVLPDTRDQTILLSYMAACIQHKGVKFQWAPLLQGTPGNGKTLFTRCVANAIGKRYTHMPKADDIDNKFNGWMLNKLFIGIEDIYVPSHKQEVMQALLPMITNTELEIQMKGVDQVTMSVCANFILNTNPRDGIRKTRDDRRFAVFFTAQQSADDIIRDGMGGDYFPDLYKWLRSGGYAMVHDYLATYPIPDELNPATSCHRAPQTSTTDEAVGASIGNIEQEILEAIDEGRQGFAKGWISSMALERLLQSLNVARAISHNRRREILKTLGYDWHPALKDGRVNNAIMIDNGKPKLFIKNGHIHANLETPAEVARCYQEAQGVPVAATGVSGHAVQ